MPLVVRLEHRLPLLPKFRTPPQMPSEQYRLPSMPLLSYQPTIRMMMMMWVSSVIRAWLYMAGPVSTAEL